MRFGLHKLPLMSEPVVEEPRDGALANERTCDLVQVRLVALQRSTGVLVVQRDYHEDIELVQGERTGTLRTVFELLYFGRI